jgi:hypothetical protein
MGATKYWKEKDAITKKPEVWSDAVCEKRMRQAMAEGEEAVGRMFTDARYWLDEHFQNGEKETQTWAIACFNALESAYNKLKTEQSESFF